MGQRGRRVVTGAAGVAVGALLTSVLVGQTWATRAMADSVGGTPTGSYTVKVTLSGNGVGGGNAYSTPGSSSPGTVTVPSLCQRDTDSTETMAAWRNYWHNSNTDTKGMTDDQIKKYITKTYIDGSDSGGAPGTITWETQKSYQIMVEHFNDDGNIYSSYCTGTQSDSYFQTFTANNPPFFVPPGGAPPEPFEPPVPVQGLLAVAEKAMTLPTITSVSMNPVGRTYVKLPTYVWANESAPVDVGTTRTVRVDVQAGGRQQFAEVTATYGTTTFDAGTGQNTCTADDTAKAASYANGQPASCILFTAASTRATVTADSQWTATSQVCNIDQAYNYACTTPPVPDADMTGTGNISVAEIQTLDR